jgi:SM-20-related protein
MQVDFERFDPERFSFHDTPVLVIEKFLTDEERQHFQHAMHRAAWKSLREMRHLCETFPDCGNWLKADMAQAEARVFLDRLALLCIRRYVERNGPRNVNKPLSGESATVDGPPGR